MSSGRFLFLAEKDPLLHTSNSEYMFFLVLGDAHSVRGLSL
jgi:hypothetical protein